MLVLVSRSITVASGALTIDIVSTCRDPRRLRRPVHHLDEERAQPTVGGMMATGAPIQHHDAEPVKVGEFL